MDILDHDLYEQEQLLKKYKRRVTAARIVMFIPIAWSLLGIVASLMLRSSLFSSGVKRQLITDVVLLIVILISYVRPFICLLLFSLFHICDLFIGTLGDFRLLKHQPLSLPVLTIIIVSLIDLLFVIIWVRGTIAAGKYEKLLKITRQQTT